MKSVCGANQYRPKAAASATARAAAALANGCRWTTFGRRIRSASLLRPLTSAVFFCPAVRGVGGDEVANPAQHAARPQPKSRSDDQPEDSAQEFAVVDLSHPRHDERQNRRDSRFTHDIERGAVAWNVKGRGPARHRRMASAKRVRRLRSVLRTRMCAK